MKITCESKPVYGEDVKYIKIQIKIYAGNIITNFHNKKMHPKKAPCKCLSMIKIDSVIQANKKYYPQKLLEDSESDSDTNNETESNIDNE